MVKPLVLFCVSTPNMYSFAKLLSCIENNSQISLKYDILVLRQTVFELSPSRIKKYQIAQRPYVIIPLSLMTAQRSDFQHFCMTKLKKLKELNENLLLLVGGWHPTGDPEDTLKLGADYVITGEAEISFPKFLIEFTENSQSIPKIYCINETVDLNTHPPYSEKYRVFCPIEISRGCPFRCKFCQTGRNSNLMRHASPEKIVEWVHRAAKIRYDRVWFTTPNAFAYGSPKGSGTNPSLVRNLLHQIKCIPDLDEIYFGSFPSEVRPDYVTNEMMDAVHPYISNNFFTIGVQTASNRLLKEIQRGHNFEDVLYAIDLILSYGYGVDLDFIFGLPGETEEDLDTTVDFFNEILHSTNKIRIHTHTFMPLPGTPFQYKKVGTIPPKVNKILGKLASRNKAYGSHEKQSQLY